MLSNLGLPQQVNRGKAATQNLPNELAPLAMSGLSAVTPRRPWRSQVVWLWKP
jgi:hypothetical protein